MSLFIRKPIEQLMSQTNDSKGLKRTLGPGNLIALGIGAIIGAGLFVRTAAAAGEAAGPGVVISVYNRRHRLRICWIVLCRVCRDDSHFG